MNVILAYASLTGNTRKLAEAMAEALGVQPLRIKEVPPTIECDLLFLGSGGYGTRPSRHVRRFLRDVPTLQGVKVALFGTYGGSPHQLDVMANLVQKKDGEILGRFSCKGRDWAFLGLIARSHPTEAELDAAVAFARAMREKAERALNARLST